MAQWEWNQTNTIAATDTVFPDSSEIDDYPYQNKLGNLLETDGASLKIVR
mgnify:FL=1